MLRFKPIILLVALVVLFSAATVMAQGGGKAEPLRIELKRGTNSITINDKIKDDQQAEYVLSAERTAPDNQTNFCTLSLVSI